MLAPASVTGTPCCSQQAVLELQQPSVRHCASAVSTAVECERQWPGAHLKLAYTLGHWG